ncbi:uncharacterized protein B0H64DRAFT_84277 [Chaetomium fimeti]|uniref:Uncharacterized protein n=1 Tax=Chaetomium fimeti TaxID=1854472 RepID=A0AAE0HLQ4_9PEZI|nr:hypothetical protein B0H64DRAFT_84277 [Chaetomium fimeti]
MWLTARSPTLRWSTSWKTHSQSPVTQRSSMQFRGHFHQLRDQTESRRWMKLSRNLPLNEARCREKSTDLTRRVTRSTFDSEVLDQLPYSPLQLKRDCQAPGADQEPFLDRRRHLVMTSVDSRSRSIFLTCRGSVFRISGSCGFGWLSRSWGTNLAPTAHAEQAHLDKPGEGDYQDHGWSSKLDISLLEECTVHDRHARVRYRIDRGGPERGRSGSDIKRTVFLCLNAFSRA